MFGGFKSFGGPLLPLPDLPFEWDRSGTRRAITVFTDTSLLEAERRNDCYKVAWLLESPRNTRPEYRWLGRNPLLFDRVLTFEQNFLENLPRARFSPCGGCWLAKEGWKIHPKTQNLSTIVSEKRAMPGQKLRHEVIQKHAAAFDAILGRGFREIDDKIEGLKDYRYSLAIENCRQNFYFTEKIIDCFMTGTVPIYWGCPSIGLFSGILNGRIATFTRISTPGKTSVISSRVSIKACPIISWPVDSWLSRFSKKVRLLA